MGRSELEKLLEKKKVAKKHLFDECWPDSKLNEPLIVVFPKNGKADLEMTFELLKGILVLPVKALVVTDELPPDFVKHPHAPKIDEWLTAADMAIIFDESRSTVNALFKKGVVPVGHEKSPALSNYHPNEETGNAFTFGVMNPWSVFSAVVRACETYRFPFDWRHIVQCMMKVR